MRAFTAYIGGYSSTTAFRLLANEAARIAGDLARVRYQLQIKGSRVTVSSYNGATDYSEEVAAVFAKFKGDAVKDYRATFRSGPEMDGVEGQVLNLVARINPVPFAALDAYFQANQGFVDSGVAAFDRDSQFYLAYLGYIDRFRATGLPFCYPSLSTTPVRTVALGCFDVALAAKVAMSGLTIVTNDLELGPKERVVVVTGPNNGGKTTFARALGQLHYLASLGLPVPARQAELVLADRVLTSFQQAEQLETTRSHLEDELVHLRNVVERATPATVVVMNESFASTTLRDAAVLGKALLAQLLARGSLCFYVTFVDELASANDATVSLAAAVDPEDPVVHTYRFVRNPPEGLAYAAALAERYGLTYGAVEEQVAQ
jgi:DNA mismatch repair protein MutS